MVIGGYWRLLEDNDYHHFLQIYFVSVFTINSVPSIVDWKSFCLIEFSKGKFQLSISDFQLSFINIISSASSDKSELSLILSEHTFISVMPILDYSVSFLSDASPLQIQLVLLLFSHIGFWCPLFPQWNNMRLLVET